MTREQQRTADASTLSAVASANIRRFRVGANLNQVELGERVAALGVPMNRSVVANIESGRRTSLSIEELAAFAIVLNVAPVNLLLPADVDASVSVAPAVVDTALNVRSWICGSRALESATAARTLAELRALWWDFIAKAPAFERRSHDERFWRHPLYMELTGLAGHLRTATLGEDDRVRDDDPPPRLDIDENRKALAQALRQHADEVRKLARATADDVEQGALPLPATRPEALPSFLR